MPRPGARGAQSEPDRFAAGVLPARAGSLTERCGRLAFDDELHIVHRHVRLSSEVAAARLGGMVRCDVPAAHRQVDAAAIRDAVVDDHELLVMRCAEGQMIVEQDLDALGLRKPKIQRGNSSRCTE